MVLARDLNREDWARGFQVVDVEAEAETEGALGYDKVLDALLALPVEEIGLALVD